MLPGWQVCLVQVCLPRGRAWEMLQEGDRRRGGQGGWRDGFTMGLHKVYLENEAHLPLQYNNNNSSSTWHLSLAAHFRTKCFT